MAERRRSRLLTEMAQARRSRSPARLFEPSEEERKAIAEGTLLVFKVLGMEPFVIDLRRASEVTTFGASVTQ